MAQSMQTALTRSFVGARTLGYNFNMVAIPDDVNVGNDPLAFDPVQMRAAFDAGRALGAQDNSWQNVPTNAGDLPDWFFKGMMAPSS